MKLTFVIFNFLMVCPVFGQQQGLNTSSQEALIQTQQLLNNKTERENKIASDPLAVQADAFTKKLMGDAQLTDEVYALAAEVFAIVVQNADGDVNKIHQAVDMYSRNPASFADKWTPEQKAKLKKLSDKLPQTMAHP